MPQLSLYLDHETLKKIESAAKREKVSISQWVKSKLQNSFDKKWPEEYFQLFGSIQDETFLKPNSLKLHDDLKRENF